VNSTDSGFQPAIRFPERVSRSTRDWGCPARRNLPIILLAIGLLSACRIESLTPTPNPTPTISPTAELPLTSLLPTLGEGATETPGPTPTWTPVVTRPQELRARIFYDPLDDNRYGWTLPKSEGGSAAFSNGMLVFTANVPFTSLSATLAKEVPSDGYIEVTIQTIICGAGIDTFGIIFRNQGGHSYRFAITCRGQLRLERYADPVLEGASVWKDTLGLLQGAPAANRIGVMMQGNIFRFFVNGAEAFSSHDPVSIKGGAGLFVQSEKSQMLSVGFDELSVYPLNSPSQP
jgi:hypothetical protein